MSVNWSELGVFIMLYYSSLGHFHGVSTLIPLPYFTEPSPNHTQTLVTINVLRHHQHPTLHHIPPITNNKHLLPIITLVPYNQ